MTVREHSNVTYVLLDFEGLGSFERSAQEDMLLSAAYLDPDLTIIGLLPFETFQNQLPYHF